MCLNLIMATLIRTHRDLSAELSLSTWIFINFCIFTKIHLDPLGLYKYACTNGMTLNFEGLTPKTYYLLSERSFNKIKCTDDCLPSQIVSNEGTK